MAGTPRARPRCMLGPRALCPPARPHLRKQTPCWKAACWSSRGLAVPTLRSLVQLEACVHACAAEQGPLSAAPAHCAHSAGSVPGTVGYKARDRPHDLVELGLARQRAALVQRELLACALLACGAGQQPRAPDCSSAFARAAVTLHEGPQVVRSFCVQCSTAWISKVASASLLCKSALRSYQSVERASASLVKIGQGRHFKSEVAHAPAQRERHLPELHL